MTMEFVTEYVEKKLEENKDFVCYSFFELRVKNNLSQDDVDNFLSLNKEYFTNKGYSVYYTGDYYTYKGETKQVRDNEMFIAIRG